MSFHQAARVQRAPNFQQASFDEIDDLLPSQRPLREVTFVVVDLETTGGSPAECGITEIGAVKVRGGEVLGEFGTLVNPGSPIPPTITVLTGITDAMVVAAPEIDSVIPAFLEFAQDTVLVAHNAPFDTGFLRAACARLGQPWPRFTVVDTVTLARRVLPWGETPNHKLGTLAALFRAETTPNHRALDDARATVDVLHGLIGRLGNQGVHTLGELVAFNNAVSEAQRAKRRLGDGLPQRPGVYIFRAADDRPLYVGTSRNIYRRVRNYFLASETRSRMGEMIAAAERVDAITCAHALEAEVRELRLIAAHAPPYNRRSKYPERAWWLTVTAEAYPRLSVTRKPPPDLARGCGPFRSMRSAQAAASVVYEALPIRQCTSKLSATKPTTACALAELGRCGAPCDHRETREGYGEHVDLLLNAFSHDPTPLLEPILGRLESLAAQTRYEEAATTRDYLTQLMRKLIGMQTNRALVSVRQLLAAGRREDGSWELCVIRHGRLAAAGVSRETRQVLGDFDVLLATAETVLSPDDPHAARRTFAEEEETARIIAWLERPGVRVVRVDGVWACPTWGAGRWRGLLEKLTEANTYASAL